MKHSGGRNRLRSSPTCGVHPENATSFEALMTHDIKTVSRPRIVYNGVDNPIIGLPPKPCDLTEFPHEGAQGVKAPMT